MGVFIVFVIVAAGGIGFVLWNMKNDSESESSESGVRIEKIKPSHPKSTNPLAPKEEPLDLSIESTEEKKPKKESKSIVGKLLGKINISGLTSKIKVGGKSLGEIKKPESKPLPSLKDFMNKDKDAASTTAENPLAPKPATDASEETIPLVEEENQLNTGTASITTHQPSDNPKPAETPDASLSTEEEKSIEKEVESTVELSELKEKYEKVDKMLQEKTEALAKAESSLGNEEKNRKEFNKVKDILEKELKDVKDNSRNVQVELNSAVAEKESFKKRVDQLEEKVTKLEKEIVAKEKELEELNKSASKEQLQTPAQPPKDENPNDNTANIADEEPKEEEIADAPETPVEDVSPQDDKPEPTEDKNPATDESTVAIEEPKEAENASNEPRAIPEEEQQSTAEPQNPENLESSNNDEPNTTEENITPTDDDIPVAEIEKPEIADNIVLDVPDLEVLDKEDDVAPITQDPVPEHTKEAPEEKPEGSSDNLSEEITEPEKSSAEEEPVIELIPADQIPSEPHDPEEPKPEDESFLTLKPDVMSTPPISYDETENTDDTTKETKDNLDNNNSDPINPANEADSNDDQPSTDNQEPNDKKE